MPRNAWLACAALGLLACTGELSGPSAGGAGRAPHTSSSALVHGNQLGWAIDNSGQVLISEDDAARVAATGARWVRVNFRLGPHTSDSSAFYAAYDTIVGRLRAKGLEVLGVISNETWPGTQADWIANSHERSGGDGHNTYLDQLGYAFARMAKHFEGRIRVWEVWNEPDAWTANPSPGVYTGGSFIYPSNFAALLTHCHSQVRHYNKIDVKIVSGGLFGHDIGGFSRATSGASYLDATYDAGINKTGKFAWAKSTYGSYPLDAVGQHIYINAGEPVSASWFGAYLDYVQEVVARHEGSQGAKKTWLTEFGWATDGVSESVQSSNLAAAYGVIDGKTSYLEAAFLFQLDDNEAASPPLYYGLFRPDGSKKPAWATVQAAVTGSTAGSGT